MTLVVVLLEVVLLEVVLLDVVLLDVELLVTVILLVLLVVEVPWRCQGDVMLGLIGPISHMHP